MAESIPPLPQTVEAELTRSERKEVAKRLRPSVTILHETIRAEGEVELHRPATALAWSAFAAGLSMGYSLVAMAMLRCFLPDAPWRPLVVNLGYSVGFLIVILGRQQLFTENTLTPVLPLLHNRDGDTLLRVLRLWGVVLASNVAGALLFAAVVAHTPAFRPEMRAAFHELATDAMEGSAAVHMLRAIFSGWLIALMVWLLPNAETARVFIVVMLTYVIGVAGLSHVVAGSVETLYGVTTGAVSIPSWLGRFFLPVLVGNMIGGMALVASFTHAEIAAETGDREMEPTERRIRGSATSDRPRPRRAPDGASAHR